MGGTWYYDQMDAKVLSVSRQILCGDAFTCFTQGSGVQNL